MGGGRIGTAYPFPAVCAVKRCQQQSCLEIAGVGGRDAQSPTDAKCRGRGRSEPAGRRPGRALQEAGVGTRGPRVGRGGGGGCGSKNGSHRGQTDSGVGWEEVGSVLAGNQIAT